MVLSLYAKGMTTRDISEHLKLTFGADVSHETIANITDAINETVKEWRNRPPDEAAGGGERRDSGVLFFGVLIVAWLGVS